ncbi:MAG: ROK family transcriptional regulator [Rhodobacteraceae bacterium]|nr:ROK family transcriptional regulator [Paracoccaceae bacterium]
MAEAASTGSSPRRIRLSNAAAALRALHAGGPLSRAELARRLGLNRSSSGQIVAELTQAGLVREVEDTSAGRKDRQRGAGRPGILLGLADDAAFFVGIEIGVEHISAVTIDLSGRIRSQRREPFDAPRSPVADTVARAVELAFAGEDSAVRERCRGVGVSSPVHITGEGRVSLAPLIGWRDLPLLDILRAALPVRVPVAIENDANAFALGDAYKHGAAGVTLFLLMETGVGGGILIDGRLFRGSHGLAGEIGHMLVPGSGGISLEELIGREALVARYRAEAGRPAAEIEDFLAAVRDREPAAVLIAEDWSRHLGHTLFQACRMIDPDRIVLGGSVAALYPLVAARVAAHMATTRAVAFPVPPIAVDEDAEFGSAFGAACLMHQRFLSGEIEAPAVPGAAPPATPEAAPRAAPGRRRRTAVP